MQAFYPVFVAALAVAVIGNLIPLIVLLLAAALPRKVVSARQGGGVSVSAQDLPSLIVLIPAHDEELVLAATLESLARQDFPAGRREVVVIADNCSDATAEIACAHGATTLERRDDVRRGKGYALDWALSHLLRRPEPADAFVIIDADTWVAPDFLRLMAERLTAGTDTRGFCALQGRYGVLNPDQGWRAALMAGAFDLFNHVKPLGRSRLGLSVGLKGNGMAFTRAVLEQTRWRGDRLTEDIDFGLDLLRRHSVLVGYVPEARVLAQMPVEAEQAATQRARWEGGRVRLLRDTGLPLFWDGLCRCRPALCDAVWDLMQPPLAQLGALLMFWTGLIALGLIKRWLPHPHLWAGLALGSLASLCGYILGGFQVAGAPREAYIALLRAPFYALWKIRLLAVRGRRAEQAQSSEWVRTARMPLAGTSEVRPE